MRIPPDLLALRPDQKDVDAAVINMADPFTEEILREQAETARRQAGANIIEESQAPHEEFVPSQGAPAKSVAPPRPPRSRAPRPFPHRRDDAGFSDHSERQADPARPRPAATADRPSTAARRDESGHPSDQRADAHGPDSDAGTDVHSVAPTPALHNAVRCRQAGYLVWRPGSPRAAPHGSDSGTAAPAPHDFAAHGSPSHGNALVA